MNFNQDYQERGSYGPENINSYDSSYDEMPLLREETMRLNGDSMMR